MCLIELRDRILMIPALEKRLESLEAVITKSKNDVSRLLSSYEKESQDVERLQKDSFSSFLLRLTRKYEDKLEKEQRDEINAKIEYDRAVTRYEHLMNAKNELAGRISALKLEERKFLAKLDDKKDNLSSQDNIRYRQLEDERKIIVSQITEIENALRIAARTKSVAQAIAASLNSAESWATFDVVTKGGGIITHMAKYSHIDAAEKNFNILSHNLRELNDSLKDVQGIKIGNFNEISSGQRTVDFWFNNIFTSLSVKKQVVENAHEMNRLIKTISGTESTLNSILADCEKMFLENQKQREELIVNA